MPVLYRFTSGCTLWDQVFHFLIFNFDVLVLALSCANFYNISYLNISYYWVILGFWSPLKSSWKSVFKGQFARQLWIARDFIWKWIDDAICEMTRKKTRGICLVKCLGHKEFRGCLVSVFKQQFSVFKQHFTYFHTLFHPHVFP